MVAKLLFSDTNNLVHEIAINNVYSDFTKINEDLILGILIQCTLMVIIKWLLIK